MISFIKKILILLVYISFVHNNAQQKIEKDDEYTMEKIAYEKVNSFSDGSPMTIEKCDGIIYISQGKNFYKRIINTGGYINIKWFGAKGNADKNDLGTDDTEAIKKAIKTLGNIYKGYQLSGGNIYGGFTLFFPSGKYIVNETLQLPNGITIQGESMTNTIIHAKTPRLLFTNITGFGKNGIDQISSEYITFKDITLTQGGIELQQATGSLLQNIRIMNLSGKGTDTGVTIKLSVQIKLDNVKIFSSSGIGILYEDSAGSGPSTTTTFDRVWVAHCKTGMKINGLAGGSHGILTSKIYNSIFEYNETGLEIQGNVENLTIRDSHFEQNKKNTILITGNIEAMIENNWSDKGGITIDKNINGKSKITLKGNRMPVENLSTAKQIIYQ